MFCTAWMIIWNDATNMALANIITPIGSTRELPAGYRYTVRGFLRMMHAVMNTIDPTCNKL